MNPKHRAPVLESDVPNVTSEITFASHVADPLVTLKSMILHLDDVQKEELLVFLSNELYQDFWDSHTVGGRDESGTPVHPTLDPSITEGLTQEQLDNVYRNLGWLD